jgi:DNA-binding MarR family transcriptional regulator
MKIHLTLIKYRDRLKLAFDNRTLKECKESLLLDNEYIIMSEVSENENVSQRELSRKLGVSVSTVNVLINKMIREGLIKMTLVSQKQVLYMLTPVGMMEKARKTVRYLKAHYRAIYETKEKIKNLLEELCREYDVIYVLMSNDEMSEILSIAVHEYKSTHSIQRQTVNRSSYVNVNIKMIQSIVDIDVKNYKLPVLLHMTLNEEAFIEYEHFTNLKIVNLVEVL